jgi:hypothetical protein
VPRTKYRTAYVWKLDFVNKRVRWDSNSFLLTPLLNN